MFRIGTPVTINGRTGGTPGPAPVAGGSPLRVRIPNPSRPKGLPVNSGLDTPMCFCREITFQNLDATNNLLVYLGNQQNEQFFTIAKGAAPLTLRVLITEFYVISSAAATVQWEAVAIVAG